MFFSFKTELFSQLVEDIPNVDPEESLENTEETEEIKRAIPLSGEEIYRQRMLVSIIFLVIISIHFLRSHMFGCS